MNCRRDEERQPKTPEKGVIPEIANKEIQTGSLGGLVKEEMCICCQAGQGTATRGGTPLVAIPAGAGLRHANLLAEAAQTASAAPTVLSAGSADIRVGWLVVIVWQAAVVSQRERF